MNVPKPISPFAWLWSLSFTVLLSVAPSYAVLGESAASVQTDQARINASLRITQARNYAVHELQTASGASVREYVSPQGKVFAVAWQGASRPDLRQLLGAHFEEFRQALESRQRGGARGPISIELPGLVVQLGGHMRDFRGRAYLPAELPSEVGADEIN